MVDAHFELFKFMNEHGRTQNTHETDREKVIKGLYEAAEVIKNHIPVRYIGYAKQACHDAIALLKEPDTVEHALSVLKAHGWKDGGEAVKPIEEGSEQYRWFRCGKCAEPLYGPWNYCPKCGRAVKWDDAE